MRTVALVSCAKGKLDRPAMARALYCSPLFRMSLDYAEQIASPESVFVLSAKHGLVHPMTELEPYDLAVSDLDEFEQAYWRQSVAIQLADALGLAFEANAWPGVRVVLLASELYRPDVPCEVETPLAGMQIGQRLQWLRTQIETRRVA